MLIVWFRRVQRVRTAPVSHIGLWLAALCTGDVGEVERVAPLLNDGAGGFNPSELIVAGYVCDLMVQELEAAKGEQFVRGPFVDEIYLGSRDTALSNLAWRSLGTHEVLSEVVDTMLTGVLPENLDFLEAFAAMNCISAGTARLLQLTKPKVLEMVASAETLAVKGGATLSAEPRERRH